MTLGQAIEDVLKLAEHTASKLPEPHKAKATEAIDYLTEFQRGFCIAHTDHKRRTTP